MPISQQQLIPIGEETEQVEKYSTRLRPSLVKWLKREALERDMKDYQLLTKAVEHFKQQTEASQ